MSTKARNVERASGFPERAERSSESVTSSKWTCDSCRGPPADIDRVISNECRVYPAQTLQAQQLARRGAQERANGGHVVVISSAVIRSPGLVQRFETKQDRLERGIGAQPSCGI